jgi:hypothetical protein
MSSFTPAHPVIMANMMRALTHKMLKINFIAQPPYIDLIYLKEKQILNEVFQNPS